MQSETTLGEGPRFRTLSPNYIRDTYVPADVEIELRPDDGLNPDLEPLNEPAQRMMESYLRSLPSPIRSLDAVVGEAYANRPREATATQVVEIRKTHDPHAPNVMGVKRSEDDALVIVPPEKRRGRPRKIMGNDGPLKV